MGLAILATKDKTKLISKLTKKAAASVDSYADISPLDASTDLSPIADVAAVQQADQVSPTFYVPVLFPNCPEPQWALIDTGAQVSLITTTCAKYCNLVDPQYQNIIASNLKVGGVSGSPW